MSERGTKGHLFRQAAGAAAWGVFLSIAPFDILFVGAVVWIPLLIWAGRVWAARYGFWPGAVRRYGVIAGVVTIAALAPVKLEDQRVGPLPRATVTLGELADAGVIHRLRDKQQVETRVTLPSTTPTRLEVMAAINQQTGLRAWIFHCLNGGASILTGGGIGRVRVSER